MKQWGYFTSTTLPKEVCNLDLNTQILKSTLTDAVNSFSFLKQPSKKCISWSGKPGRLVVTQQILGKAGKKK